MASYTYKAIGSDGRRKRGTTTADTPRQAREKLRHEGLKVEFISERRSNPTESGRGKGRLRYQSQATMMIRELSTLLQAGIPLLKSIDTVLQQTKGGFHEALLSVRDRVASGSGLADAMALEPHAFDDMTIGMVRVGEHAGNLDEVCEQVADYRERSGELRDRVLSALLYPAIVLSISVAVTIFLMTVVVPMLLTNLIEIGRPLPMPTRILKWVSDVLLDYGPYLFLSAAMLGIGLTLFLRSQRGRRLSETIAIKTPVLGGLVQRQVLSRMAFVISSLLRSGVELVDAIGIAERSSSNGLLREALHAMRRDLESGQDLRDAALQNAIFTPSVAQVFVLGQQSGQLDRMLLRIGNDYDRQAALLAARLTTIVEPLLILVLSVIVGFVLFATVLPILEAGNVLAG
ncbi:Type II secretion system protein F [Crateriforma conspicua]|uniref:General secretion pathway protein F n=1 Tax=Crateriforma conspicua TaxID=2527996 RepID=A0A5C6FJA2_9PLAN|nr:type II secretion system F family protein [Crateriforma conspicua]TWU62325.1 Type II secretion system protein F [Crateriforma conspicua]